MQAKLQKAWFTGEKWVWVLLPLTLLFILVSSLRRFVYRCGIKSQYKSSLPVIVVGNIGIGGNGKTPLTLSLIQILRERGYTCAVLSRGYGGTQKAFPYLLQQNDVASVVGDEPFLIKHRSDCIVVIDPLRRRGAQFIEQHTDADIIICDDGMQHYALARDIELCVIDKRGLGNGYLLPMGPLREGKWRLQSVSAVVHNLGFCVSKPTSIVDSDKCKTNSAFEVPSHVQQIHMQLTQQAWRNVSTGELVDTEDFMDMLKDHQSKEIVALAGIGEPKRFFDTLDALDIKVSKCIDFPDHHHFSSEDIPNDALVLMTEKDAVKCQSFAHEACWYLQIDAMLSQNIHDVLNAKCLPKTQLA